jgi:hypothetical protein
LDTILHCFRPSNLPTFQSSILPALVGRSRGALAAALRDYEVDSLDYPMIRGLAAVLEARCSFGDGLHWLRPQPEDHKSKEDSTSLEIDLVCPRPSL